MTLPIGPGVLVQHKAWGVGKVVHVNADHWVIHFPSLATTIEGPQRKLKAGTEFIAIAETQSDPVLDGVPVGLGGPHRPTGQKRSRRPPPPLVNGLEQTVAWFLDKYPGRFEDPTLIEHELEYKWKAHRYFEDALGGGKARELLRVADGSTIADHLKRLYHATNIPSRFEVMAANDGLYDASAAMRLLDGLMEFMEKPEADEFQNLVEAVGSLPATRGRARVQTWPNVTILPFLADPTRFMVFKPKISRRMARRMGMDLLYSSKPSWHAYEALLEMSGVLMDRLRPIGARDFIDVQSFMWVTQEVP